jgi:glycerol-3-phosphate dehydrogenase
MQRRLRSCSINLGFDGGFELRLHKGSESRIITAIQTKTRLVVCTALMCEPRSWLILFCNLAVELAGAGKNVYAIAAGISDGLGFENNTRAGMWRVHRPLRSSRTGISNCDASLSFAGLITRSLAEMTRIGKAFGASPITFLSLAGVGDLFLTCTSTNSRNYTVGYRLGKGEKLDHILGTLGSVAEGVSTTKGYKEVIDRVGVEAPIAQAVYSVIYEVKINTSLIGHVSF